MQLTAKLVQVMPAQTGQGRNGEWKKQEIIVETDGQYPKKICVSVWGDRMAHLTLNPGELLTIDFELESREFNGRWYTDVKAWKVTGAQGGGGSQSSSAYSNQSTYGNQGGYAQQSNNFAQPKKPDAGFPSAPPSGGGDSFEDDLPF